ncbi:phenoloxidase 2-like [Ischnura elegans]|uniref:phenoloxidase 2-like n=1 Tax=Ischnura elegans TaxID=197161 RepID=UPI001ED870BF|nr:phenoloxidase 2-like [Ischnura elegans]
MANTVDQQHQLLYLLGRPTEPIFVPKGDRGAVFDIPSNDFLAERFQDVAGDLGTRFGEDTNVRVPVRNITLPDLSFPMRLGRQENFSLFLPWHREMATRLIEIFMGMRTYEDFLAVSVYARDRVNPYMYIYAMSVAILHRPDTRGLQLPPMSEILPEKFVDGGVFDRAREQSNVRNEGTRVPIEIPRDYTASDLEEEHRVAYFREDVGINLHHWHWHLVYPFQAPLNIVRKDRRGELFFYMHQQIQARYNFERLCNRLGRVKRLLNLREPIEEGYFPKLDTLVASRNYPPRPSGSKLSDINREADQIRFDIADLERWRDRIIEAIQIGRVINTKGEVVELTEEGGIDILGDIVEASILSINPNLYGNVHNLGHFLLALPHDPDQRHLETFSVMADPTTAMRDPVFYRWHAFTDDLFQIHKRTLPSYPANKLDYQGVRITNIEVTTKGAGKNEMTTFWEQNDIDLSRGLDFTPRGPVFARLTQLQHETFTYKIQVENTSNSQRMGTVRIYLAPKFDERGQPWLFRDQRNMFIELDKFVVTLGRQKTSTITRESSQSSITIPFESTFRDLESSRPSTGGQALEAFNYCGCGWPQHMLIPRGTPEGFPCQLFIMISDIKDDMVEGSSAGNGACAESASFCGIRDKKYPDRRSMGYPFDRVPRSGVDTLQQFLTPNMAVTDVRIVFTNRTEPGRSVSNQLP